MKLNTRNLLIILGSLVVIYALTQLTKGTSRSSSLRTDLVQIDTTQVTSVIIKSPGEEVELRKVGGEWSVKVGNGIRPVREGAVKSLLNMLNAIKPSRLAAKKRENWKDYQVDSTGTDVKVFDGEDMIANVVIGRFGMEGQRSFYSFVRLAEEENVYAANDFMGGSVAKNTAGYRENILMRIKKDSLTAIRFNYPDSAYSLVKNEIWFLDDQPADSAAVVKFLNGLSLVSSRNFYDETMIGNPSYAVTFSFANGNDIILEAFADRDGFILRSSENEAELFKDESVEKKIFVGAKEFLQ